MSMKPEKLLARAERCVCKMCGGGLELRVIIYNKYGGSGTELYCPNCQKIEYGTEPELYRLAQDYIAQVEYDYFTEMEQDQRHAQLNVAKVCETLSWMFKRLEIMDGSGLHKDCLCNFDYEEDEC